MTTMTKKIFVDRSRYETGQRCLRSRYLEYHFGPEGMGITSARKPLPLAVGSSVHAGLAELLRIGSEQWAADGELSAPHSLEEAAVTVALADFAQYAKRLELPDAERAGAADAAPKSLTAQLMDSLGQDSTEVRATNAADARSAMDDYLFAEQSALVEGMVRAYARRRLRPLLEQFEVLEVEREGEWKLSNWKGCKHCGGKLIWGEIGEDDDIPHNEYTCANCGNKFTDDEFGASEYELWFMSRPDALLRERESNQLYLLSYKTAASWDVRKARDAEHDMQGMSEGVEIERRLAGWWEALRPQAEGKLPQHTEDSHINGKPCPRNMQMFLQSCDAPPRILAVRYEYMLKGERWKDKELSERFGAEMRSQKSHLIRQYVAVSVPQRGAAGYSIGDSCWSWDYIRDDGRDGSLAWQNWKSRPVWEGQAVHTAEEWGKQSTVKAWIDKLDDAAEAMSGEDSTMGLEPRLLGYKCDAQAVGVTREHPLDAVFIPPIHVYRNEDELRDMVDQMESVERRIAEGVAAVDGATDDGERRHLLNVHFPQTRRACSYPTECAYVKICYGGEDIRRDPLASGLYTIRTVNHPQELENKNV